MPPNNTMMITPAAINSNTDIVQAMYVAMCKPLSRRSAKAAYKDSKNMFITAHQIVHRSVRFHSKT